jgi:hypothetical protein
MIITRSSIVTDMARHTARISLPTPCVERTAHGQDVLKENDGWTIPVSNQCTRFVCNPDDNIITCHWQMI